ncbi:MAG: hypothetical protein U1E05_19610, partial [Patescibacteria group bacterium]|nr:hypothetical protein [Patescibacteria group bacterium]
LTAGTADYLSVIAPEGVFACLRVGTVPDQSSPAWHADYAWELASQPADRAAVVLVNLDGRLASGKVSLPAACLPESLRAVRMAHDLMTGQTLPVRHEGETRELSIVVPPLGYTVLRFGGEKLPAQPPVPVASDTHPVQTEPPAEPWDIATEVGALRIDPETGLAMAWWKDGRELAGAMDLALPKELADAGGKVECRGVDGGLEVTRTFGAKTLTLRYSPDSEGGVAVVAAWDGVAPAGAAIIFNAPAATAWRAQTAEGLFASPFRVRHPECDGVIGSIYRLPQGTAVLWDSRRHPFGLAPELAWLAADSTAGQAVFAFDPDCLPAAVQVLDRVGPTHGMKVLMAWRDRENGVECGVEELRFRVAASTPKRATNELTGELMGERTGERTGERRLRAVGGGWEFENAHYRVRVARTGALAGLWRREGDGWQTVLRHGGAYTDRGFGDVRYAQENDVEANMRWERRGEELTVRVSGVMRGFGRFEKMYQPVGFYSEYTFSDGPAFQYACAVRTGRGSAADHAFLSLLLRTAGANRATFADADGVFLAGDRGDGNARFNQLAGSDSPERLPTDVRLYNADRLLLRLGGIEWFGPVPQNVFMHGEDLHLAWMDGKPERQDIQPWSAVTCSIACDDVAVKTTSPWPFAGEETADLLRNGAFDLTGASDVVLLSTGQELARMSDVESAWVLPPGSAYVVEDGNRCATVEGDDHSYRLIRQTLPAKAFAPGSKWRLTARMKGRGVEPGDVSWMAATLRWAVSLGDRTTYASVTLPQGDHDWQTLTAELTVPDGATGVAVEAGLNGNRGRVWIDDIRIERIDKGI